MRMEMGISQLEKPMQLSCKNRLPSADGAWQQEFFRLASRNYYNGHNPEDSGKINRWIMLRKSIGLKLQGWAVYTETWQSMTLVWCCPQKLCLDEEALSILDIGMRAAVSCTHHGDNGKKINSLVSDILLVWENLLSALSILWSEFKDWLSDVQRTRCGGVVCQTFHQGYKTIVREN